MIVVDRQFCHNPLRLHSKHLFVGVGNGRGSDDICTFCGDGDAALQAETRGMDGQAARAAIDHAVVDRQFPRKSRLNSVFSGGSHD